MKEKLTAAGFADVETHLIESSISYQSHQHFAEVLLKMPVMKNVTERFSENKKRLHQSVVEHMRLINSAEPGTFHGITILALARKTSDQE